MSCCTNPAPPRSLLVVPPSGFANTPITGGRKVAVTKVALRNNATGVYTAVTQSFRLLSPSARFRIGITVAYEADDGSEPNLTGGWTWTLQARRRNALTGRSAPLQNIFTGRALPDGYEIDSAVDEIKGTITVPNSPGTGVPTVGNLVVQCTWEPTEVISAEELQALFSACALTIDGTPITVSNTGA